MLSVIPTINGFYSDWIELLLNWLYRRVRSGGFSGSKVSLSLPFLVLLERERDRERETERDRERQKIYEPTTDKYHIELQSLYY